MLSYVKQILLYFPLGLSNLSDLLTLLTLLALLALLDRCYQLGLYYLLTLLHLFALCSRSE